MTNKTEKPEVNGTVVTLIPGKEIGKKFEGEKDVSALSLTADEVIEIKAWDSGNRPIVISNEAKNKMKENLSRRLTRYALDIKARMKENQERKLNEFIK